MLKILNNDKFTTAQNRHSLVSLKIPILNTLPVRAQVRVLRNPGRCPGLWSCWAFSPYLAADNRALDLLGLHPRLAREARQKIVPLTLRAK